METIEVAKQIVGLYEQNNVKDYEYNAMINQIAYLLDYDKSIVYGLLDLHKHEKTYKNIVKSIDRL